MIITVGNIKGGVGKSTLACNIAVLLSAVRKTPVVLIDGDKQGSSAEFTAMREMKNEAGAGYVCSRAVGSEVRQQAKGLAEQFGTVIVDAGGQNNPALRAALTVSDMVLIPVLPKSFEAWSLDAMAELVAEVRETVNPNLKAFAFVNMGFPTGGDNQFVQALVREDHPAFEMVPHAICHRKTFSDNAGRGLGIGEGKPRDLKAVEEFLNVMNDCGVYHDDTVKM